MSKFRKKPVVIEAVLFAGDNRDEIQTFAGAAVKVNVEGKRRAVVIETLEGIMVGDPGDWIIKGVKGEFYPCKPDIFEATYEPAEIAHCKSEKAPRIQEFWDAQAEWSQATFGADSERDHIGPLKHLAKEAVEAQVRPSDPVEIADCLFLVFDAARRSGMSLDTLIKVAEQKLLVNKARKWNKPSSGEAFAEHIRDEPIEHIRSEKAPQPLELAVLYRAVEIAADQLYNAAFHDEVSHHRQANKLRKILRSVQDSGAAAPSQDTPQKEK